MKHKAWLLPLLMGGSMGATYLLPKVGAVAQSAVIMKMPYHIGVWSFKEITASQDEISTLAPDTEFSKALCFSPRPGETNPDGYPIADWVDLSVVLSGSDINNSIHRPERCMPAQGHNITGSSDQILKLANGRQFTAKRLVSVQSVRNASNTKREEYLKYNCLTYYFFVGHDRVTNDHLARTFIDMKDRLFHGVDQRWAYISISMKYGKVPWITAKEVSEAEADTKIQKFLADFSEHQIDWNQISR